MHGDSELKVRVRPNGAYLSLLAVGVVVIIVGSVLGGVVGVALAVGGGVLTVVLGSPVLVSTLLRVPALVVGADGLRLPLMGVRLSWPEIATVRPSAKIRGATQTPILLVIPQQPAAVVGQARPWLRRQARDDLASYGTPLVVDDRSLDHDLAEITAAVRRHLPPS